MPTCWPYGCGSARDVRLDASGAIERLPRDLDRRELWHAACVSAPRNVLGVSRYLHTEGTYEQFVETLLCSGRRGRPDGYARVRPARRGSGCGARGHALLIDDKRYLVR